MIIFNLGFFFGASSKIYLFFLLVCLCLFDLKRIFEISIEKKQEFWTKITLNEWSNNNHKIVKMIMSLVMSTWFHQFRKQPLKNIHTSEQREEESEKDRSKHFFYNSCFSTDKNHFWPHAYIAAHILAVVHCFRFRASHAHSYVNILNSYFEFITRI